METPKEEKLRKMTYTELKKHAKDRGIKGNLKAEALISLLLENGSKDIEDSFVVLENEIINSCKKNKVAKFEQDKEVPSDTPRRETYTLERPTGDVIAIDNDLIVSSASPVLKKTSLTNETSVNVTMSRGSERKMKKRKVSFVTPLRKSARISLMTPQFASVKDRPKTPIPSRVSSGRKFSSSVKAKISFAGTPSEMEVENSGTKQSGRTQEGRVSTPMPSSKCKRMNLSSSGLKAPIATPDVSLSDQPNEKIPEETPNSDVKKETNTVFKFSATPNKKGSAKKKIEAEKLKEAALLAVNPKSIRTLTPKPKKAATPLSINSRNVTSNSRNVTRSGAKNNVTPFSANAKDTRTPRSEVKKNATPFSANAKDTRTPRSCVKSTTTPGLLSESKVKIPNFQELHKKAFAKMESIDDYQQRKAANSAKKLNENKRYQHLAKKVAEKKEIKFGGIPFVPSITSSKDMHLDASSFGSRCVANRKLGTTSRNESASAKKGGIDASKKLVKSVSRENTPLKKRFKFDLQASLTKKLPYKPHKGPIKPLAIKNVNNTSVIHPDPIKPVNENKYVDAKRVESRNLLRGVRMNRRFELQMEKRKVASK